MNFSQKTKNKIYSFILSQPNAFRENESDEGILGFLSEVWDLNSLPSSDSRYSTAYRDIFQHIINNNDWDYDYLFIERLNLFGDDTIFKVFIETIVSPKFRDTDDEILFWVSNLNKFLDKDSLALAIEDYDDEDFPIYIIQNKTSIDDLPVDVKINDIPIIVELEPNGKSKSLSSHNPPKEFPSVVLVFNPDWNDYSIKSEFSLFYYNHDKVGSYIGETKIIFDNELNTGDNIPEHFYKLNDLYCSLGQTKSYYHKLKSALGTNLESVLFALRDAAFFPQLQEVFESNPYFINSLLRFDKVQRIMRDIKHEIHGKDLDNLYNFTYTFKPKFFNSNINIDFAFQPNDTLPQRIYALIGKNGTGKTQLVTSLPRNISKKEDHFFSTGTPFFSKVIAISYSIFDKFEIPNKSAAFNYVYCGLRNEKGEFITERGLKLRFHNTWKRIEEINRINKWRKILLNFIDKDVVDQFIVPRELVENAGNSYEVDKKGFAIVRDILSSGQSIILYIVSEIVAHIRFDSLLIYDEPETHLHPNAITQLMNTIYDLVDEFESYCIIATHSPLIIRELFSRNVYVIEREGNESSIRRISIESFGENLSTITDEIFGNKDIPKHYKKIIDKLIAKGYSFEKIITLLEFDDIPLSLNARLYINSKLKLKA